MTYQAPQENPRVPPFHRPKYETLYYILIPNRWNNAVLDCESDAKANINSDHDPLVAKLCFRLKRCRNLKEFEKRKDYLPCTDYNYKYYNETNSNGDAI